MVKEEKNYDVLIIGAGLTGMTLGYLLSKTNVSFAIVEARNQIGGRIKTTYKGLGNSLEMGATWLGSKHTHLIGLLNEIGVDVFDQVIGDTAIYEAISTSPHYLAKLPPNPDPSMRIKGGTMEILNKLLESIDKNKIYLDNQVSRIEQKDSSIATYCNENIFNTKLVVSTLPPNLFINSIDLKPTLPADLLNTALSTHTWMGESIKISLTFENPFWRKDHLSGTIISNVGPIPEMYDHSNFEDNFYAIKGFLNGGYYHLTKEQRLNIVLTQLRKYFGSEIDNYTSYNEKVWRKEKYTFFPYQTNVLPHQNNGHRVYQKSYLDNSLIIAGSETSPSHPGYMDGAVLSAKNSFDRIISNLNSQ